MGRPLKIAKAQAVLTVTNTTATTNVVTVSDDLLNPANAAYGVIAGMPFIPGTTTGGLTAGTTYWILEVTGNSTFTTSATDLSANPTRTSVTLTTGTDASSLTVGLVGSGFNNPDNSATSDPSGSNKTFGVVGGNTAFYGNQVLCNVAIGVAGTGTIYADTSVAVVSGVGTDFSNTVGTSAWFGTDSSTSLGYVSSIGGKVTVTTSATTASTDRITVDDSSSLVIDGGIMFDTTLCANVVANTLYYVKAAPSGTTITVSATPGGTLIQLDDGVVAATGTQDTLTLAAVAAASASGSAYVYATPEAGYIKRQKGKTKYLAVGSTSGLTAAVYTANVANTALTPNTMCVIATTAAPATKYVKTLDDYQSEIFPTQVAASSLVADTVYTIYTSGTTDWTAVGSAGNLTGTTFVATGTGTGTGYAIAYDANPDVVATFGTAYAANTYNGQPNPVVTIAHS